MPQIRRTNRDNGSADNLRIEQARRAAHKSNSRNLPGTGINDPSRVVSDPTNRSTPRVLEAKSIFFVSGIVGDLEFAFGAAGGYTLLQSLIALTGSAVAAKAALWGIPIAVVAAAIADGTESRVQATVNFSVARRPDGDVRVTVSANRTGGTNFSWGKSVHVEAWTTDGSWRREASGTVGGSNFWQQWTISGNTRAPAVQFHLRLSGNVASRVHQDRIAIPSR